MKKIILLVSVVLGVLCTACDHNKLEDELFEKHVLINQCGFREYPLLYSADNIRDTMISIAVSGTSMLDRDVTVNLKIDPDTLEQYNWEKYRNDQSLYYQLLPADCYEMEAQNVVIKAGTLYTSIPIRFYLDRIDKEKDFVLPVSIESVSQYSVAVPEYSTVLMQVVLTNEFVGSYRMSGSIQEAGDEKLDISMTRKLRVVENNSVSFYAGNIAENAKDREDFRMTVGVNADSTITYLPRFPEKMEIVADPPVMEGDFPRNRITIQRTEDPQNSHKVSVLTTFHTFYTYKDKRDPEDIREVRVETTISRTKIIYIKD